MTAKHISRALSSTMKSSFDVPFLRSNVSIFYNPANIPISNGLSKETLFSFAPFKNWLGTLEKSVSSYNASAGGKQTNQYSLRGIEIQSIDLFGSNKIGFMKLKADLIHPNGRPLPGITVLRGGSVAMLVVLEESDSPENIKHLVLVDQPRTPAGVTSFLEIPAGMIDEESDSTNKDNVFLGAAAREMEEEIGLSITSMSDLIELTPQGKELYVSPGLLDETMRFYLYKHKLPRQEIINMQGKLRERTEDVENEVITLRIVPMDDIYTVGVQDAKTFLALGLYAQYTNK